MARHPDREINVEIVASIFRIPCGNARQGAPETVDQKDEDFDETTPARKAA
jgi:hypothetical protein